MRPITEGVNNYYYQVLPPCNLATLRPLLGWHHPWTAGVVGGQMLSVYMGPGGRSPSSGFLVRPRTL